MQLTSQLIHYRDYECIELYIHDITPSIHFTGVNNRYRKIGIYEFLPKPSVLLDHTG